ncbi:helix-turn-helix transcriptional regulator [Paenibacillus thermotolerans]|uniref:helix-turn-helix transcriptional regulator n=1 Tax=Paenibacillus thermotolerans TaxID=3027807 RepID=UPI00236890CE|nr:MULTISPECIES: AraC family transcriptional regulator [unclassified Paenibacillus]
MDFAALHPYVYYATRYPFSRRQASLSRMCYSSSLYLISEGKGALATEGRIYETKPGSLIYIPAGQKHDWIADKDDPMVHVCCYFDWAFTDRRAFFPHPHTICYQEHELIPSMIGPFFPMEIPEYTLVEKLWVWIEMFEKFYTSNEYANEKTYIRGLKVQSRFKQFIEFFLTQVLKEEHIPDARIFKLLDRLEQDLTRGQLLPLEAYYAKMQVSRGYFFELFKKATGMPPTQYINHFKINRAKEDLQFTDLSITEIAEKHCFSSIHYFSKLFRQLTGHTPKEYRDLRR